MASLHSCKLWSGGQTLTEMLYGVLLNGVRVSVLYWHTYHSTALFVSGRSYHRTCCNGNNTRRWVMCGQHAVTTLTESLSHDLPNSAACTCTCTCACGSHIQSFPTWTMRQCTCACHSPACTWCQERSCTSPACCGHACTYMYMQCNVTHFCCVHTSTCVHVVYMYMCMYNVHVSSKVCSTPSWLWHACTCTCSPYGYAHAHVHGSVVNDACYFSIKQAM